MTSPQLTQRFTRDLAFEQQFEKYFYDRVNWAFGVTWEGIPLSKNPLDLHILHELIWETKPRVIIEIGTWCGGSALWLADILEKVWEDWCYELPAFGEPYYHIFTIDNYSYWAENQAEALEAKYHKEEPNVDQASKAAYIKMTTKMYKRGIQRCKDNLSIELIRGNSQDPSIVKKISYDIDSMRESCWKMNAPVMLLHDGDHDAKAVTRDLELYAPLVSVGQYCVVEDTNSSRLAKGRSGPLEGLLAWGPEHHGFVIDRGVERFALSNNGGGWLKRIRTEPAPD